MNNTLHLTTRRRLLTSSLINAMAIAFLPAVLRMQEVDAGKKKKKGKAIGTVAERTQGQRDECESLGGGKLAVLDGSNGMNTTECKGGQLDGRVCYNTKKATTCHQDLTQSSSPLQDNGGPPSGGVNEQPGGGKPAGGSAHVDPGPAEDPGEQASGPIVLLAERQVRVGVVDEGANKRRNGRRSNRAHGKSRQR